MHRIRVQVERLCPVLDGQADGSRASLRPASAETLGRGLAAELPLGAERPGVRLRAKTKPFRDRVASEERPLQKRGRNAVSRWLRPVLQIRCDLGERKLSPFHGKSSRTSKVCTLAEASELSLGRTLFISAVTMSSHPAPVKAVAGQHKTTSSRRLARARPDVDQAGVPPVRGSGQERTTNQRLVPGTRPSLHDHLQAGCGRLRLAEAHRPILTAVPRTLALSHDLRPSGWHRLSWPQRAGAIPRPAPPHAELQNPPP